MSENSKFLDLDGLEYAIGKINENGGDGFYPYVDYVPSGTSSYNMNNPISPYYSKAYIKDDNIKLIDAGAFKGTGLKGVEFTNCRYLWNTEWNTYFWTVSQSASNVAGFLSGCFQSCYALSSISFPKCEYIGLNTFTNCTSLSNASFPECKYIGGTAFMSCSALSSIFFPKCEYIMYGAFMSCTALSGAEVYLPKCEYIGGNAFSRCSISFLDIPNVKYIGAEALRTISNISFNIYNMVSIYSNNNLSEHCTIEDTVLELPNLKTMSDFPRCPNLISLSIPNALVSYDSTFISSVFPTLTTLTVSAAFGYTNYDNLSTLKHLTITGNYSIYFSAYRYVEDIRLTYSKPFGITATASVTLQSWLVSFSASCLTVLPSMMFWGCSKLTDVYLPMLSSCYIEAFFNCSTLSTIELPELSTAGASTFRQCASLKNVSLPKLERVQDYFFSGCTALSILSLPKCSYIGWGAFAYCTSLKKLYLGSSSVVTMGSVASSVFYSCPIYTGGGSVYVPSSLWTSYRNATNWNVIAARIISY